ncbi:hypothetical protein yc1106_08622 [Curvularia clavata]|uniref:Uncharacterized protein n=1 Tax=Curvularia clavata TaxID=95742 RepID=A0A9Q8ZJP0_CURCL|nr:hypothetical protein yc1106_08622 [Curvularia clavata]
MGFGRMQYPCTPDVNIPTAFSTLLIDPPVPSLRNGGYMEDLESRYQSCRVSGIVDFCEQAHLVSAGERERWDTNMGESGDLEIQLALNRMLLGFAALWHNVKMQKLVGIDRRYPFARVAWAVLSLRYEFLSIWRLARGNLFLRIKGSELKEMRPDMFKQFSRSRSRNPSPTKWPRLQALNEDVGVFIAAELGWGDEAGDEAGNDLEDKEQQLYGADDDSGPYQSGRKRSRNPVPLLPP